MFYLLVGLLLALYYLFAAPKAIKGTLNTVLVVGLIALLLVLAILGFVKVMQSPPEIFIGLVMGIFGLFVLREVLLLPQKRQKPKG